MKVICVKREEEIFFRKGLDRGIGDLPVGLNQSATLQRWDEEFLVIVGGSVLPRSQHSDRQPDALVSDGDQENDARQISGRKFSVSFRGGAI